MQHSYMGIPDYCALFWEQVQNTECAIFITFRTWQMLTAISKW